MKREFFETWTPVMAYVLGYITADGCIQNRSDRNRPNSYQVRITSKDKEVIEKIRNQIGNMPIKNARPEPTRADRFYLTIYDSKFALSLIGLGLIPNKSKKLKPLNIPDNYFWHFLRGFTDGDGSIITVSDERTGNHSEWPMISWVGGARDFMFWLRDMISNKLFLKASKIYTLKRATPGGAISENYNFSYTGLPALAVIRMIYKESTIHMDRKYVVAERWIEDQERNTECDRYLEVNRLKKQCLPNQKACRGSLLRNPHIEDASYFDSNFGRNGSSAPWCKSCRRENVRLRRNKNRKINEEIQIRDQLTIQ